MGELEDRRKEADKIRVKGEKKDLYLHLYLSITNINVEIFRSTGGDAKVL